MSRMAWLPLALAAAAACTESRSQTAVHFDPAQRVEWPAYGGDPGAQRYSPLTNLTTANIGQLRPVWQWHALERPDVQAGSGDAVKPFTGAAANALAWAYGKYQEQVKINALREATSKMNDHVRAAADKFAKIAKLADLAGRKAQAQAVEDGKAAVDASKSMSDMNTLAMRVDQFDRELKTPPAAVWAADQLPVHAPLTSSRARSPRDGA